MVNAQQHSPRTARSVSFMKPSIAVLGFSAFGCVGTYAADRAALPTAGPLNIVTTGPGVVPSGASWVVRAAD
jgi:hypothetical protein